MLSIYAFALHGDLDPAFSLCAALSVSPCAAGLFRLGRELRLHAVWMRRLVRRVVVALFLPCPRHDQSVPVAAGDDVNVQVPHSLAGKRTLVRYDVDISAGIELLGHAGGARGRLSEDPIVSGILHVGFARDDYDVALGDGVDGLHDQELGVPGALVDLGDGFRGIAGH
jgi:hypothetical protein